METDSFLNPIMKKIGQIATEQSEAMAKRHIPNWKQKIMKLTKGKRKKPLITFGYRIDMIQLPSLEGDILRVVLIMRKKEEQLEAKEIRIFNKNNDPRNYGLVEAIIEKKEIPYEFA